MSLILIGSEVVGILDIIITTECLLNLNIFIILLMSMNVLPACMYMRLVYMEGIGSPRSCTTGNLEP